MNKVNKNIVYIDCDCEIKKFPSLFFKNANNNAFAIYNWLSTEDVTDRLMDPNRDHLMDPPQDRLMDPL